MIHEIDVDLPVRTVYDQWTQFEDFERFMPGVEYVEQVGDDALRATVKRRGVERTFDARITEQIPDTRIAWESIDEQPEHAGVVTFHHITDDSTKVMVQMEFWPTGFFEHYADKVGLVDEWVGKALDAYADFIDRRGRATGGWRGKIGRDDLELADEQDEDRSPGRGGAAATVDQRDTPSREATPLTAHGARPDGSSSSEPDARSSGGHEERQVRQMADGEIVVDDRS